MNFYRGCRGWNRKKYDGFDTADPPYAAGPFYAARRKCAGGGPALDRTGDLGVYTDGRTVSGWAEDGMAVLVKAGILKGTSDDTLSPKDYAAAEQAIVLTLRAEG